MPGMLDLAMAPVLVAFVAFPLYFPRTAAFLNCA